MKVLIVDNEQVSRKIIRGFMSRFALCEEAVNGQEAANAFINAWENRSPFDLMTLDPFIIKCPTIQTDHQAKMVFLGRLTKPVGSVNPRIPP